MKFQDAIETVLGAAKTYAEILSGDSDGQSKRVSSEIWDAIELLGKPVSSCDPIGAIAPDGTYIDQWDERLRTSWCVPIYRREDKDMAVLLHLCENVIDSKTESGISGQENDYLVDGEKIEMLEHWIVNRS